MEITRFKTTAFPHLLLVATTKKRLNVFGNLIYALEEVNNHILSHIDAFIHERMGKLSLLLVPKFGNIAIENDSIAVFIASYHY